MARSQLLSLILARQRQKVADLWLRANMSSISQYKKNYHGAEYGTE